MEADMEGLEAGLEDSKAGREISAWDSLLAGGRTWPWQPAGDTLYRWLFFFSYYYSSTTILSLLLPLLLLLLLLLLRIYRVLDLL
ncbi:hypothetical protein TRV_01636 [Trichophyton verrucosum HKI 0517]|uniref:Uncharacterized protein n=1 Tax=Trichophyton verrucosum (strain HKI 0517) TaxID=663202 RepID=D4D3H6_TRIVH|nr:uncharacterized protein TRV_01636 [Trichophyton verrucosum HKI 0517]EFE43592.1 hypothetical protein TRV_01636 [Trichophyton verrucosum HKI 0517]